MSLRNTFVYMQFHPLAYMVKLRIELSMADLIGKVARSEQDQTQNSTRGLFFIPNMELDISDWNQTAIQHSKVKVNSESKGQLDNTLRRNITL
ncbi:hypothetical protein BP6252_10772 [Coleophoma cylindrospora]|uniref:Uncharacterized protein n=1 Tax=Coleophoma cylindrospora TaxID=1849047 RepID=A0A3D8QTV8_9HELO|nr:hypothetical protein BP6252_10772 [Coleophoma cylindrospora]